MLRGSMISDATTAVLDANKKAAPEIRGGLFRTRFPAWTQRTLNAALAVAVAVPLTAFERIA